MELIVKHFSELSAEELFEIYKLRISVFVVEQNCPYQEADDADRAAYHVWLKDETGIKALCTGAAAGCDFRFCRNRACDRSKAPVRIGK